jgi:hypothetical protein
MMTYDEKLGIIRSVVDGMQTYEDGQDYIAALAKHVAIAKAHGGRVLHLVDARTAAVQPISTSGMYNSARGKVEVDKVAVILQSTLLKMQLQRLYGAMPVRPFDNPEEAIAWLLADTPIDCEYVAQRSHEG